MIRKILLFFMLVCVVAVIVLTWGSIGSAVLTFALLLSGGMLLLKTVMDHRDPDDFDWEG